MKEKIEKVTVVLKPRHVAVLDILSVQIRHKTGEVVKRAALIRAMIDAVTDSKIDLSKARSEDEIRELLAKRLKSA